MPTLDFAPVNFESQTLAADLAALLEEELPAPEDRAAAGPTAEVLDTIQALLSQAIDLVAVHKVTGHGAVRVSLPGTGDAMVTVEQGDKAHAQGLDAPRVLTMAAARIAASVAQGRKIVQPAPGTKPAAPPPMPVRPTMPPPQRTPARPPIMPPRRS